MYISGKNFLIVGCNEPHWRQGCATWRKSGPKERSGRSIELGEAGGRLSKKRSREKLKKNQYLQRN
jgi:hypothetical protein